MDVKQRKPVYVADDVHARLKAQARRERRPLQWVLDRIMRRALKMPVAPETEDSEL